MLFDNDLKDNLILTKDSGGRGWMVWLALILILCGVLAAFFWTRWRDRGEDAALIEEEEVVIAPQELASVDPGRATLAEMLSLAEKGELVESRETGHAILEKSKDESVLKEAENLLGQLNIKLIQTPQAMPEKESYLVKAGDSLERIARNFGTTVDLIKKSNGLEKDMIHPGDMLRVLTGKFVATISKSRNELVLTMNDRFFKRYSVGTGKHGTTPTGVFQIDDKIADPPWWRPDGKMLPFGDPENVLGTRWMSIKAIEDTQDVKGYGIHGTWDEKTIGQQASQGCIRLINADVEELYMLLPVGTRVVIVE